MSWGGLPNNRENGGDRGRPWGSFQFSLIWEYLVLGGDLGQRAVCRNTSGCT